MKICQSNVIIRQWCNCIVRWSALRNPEKEAHQVLKFDVRSPSITGDVNILKLVILLL